MTSEKSTDSVPNEISNPKGKWVYCYHPLVDCRVKVTGETVNYWLVDHPQTRVVKCACSTPSTKAKAVRTPHGST